MLLPRDACLYQATLEVLRAHGTRYNRPRSYARTLVGQEYAGARESPAFQERQRPVRVLERERRRRRADGDPCRFGQELLAVGPRVGGDTPDVALVEEIALVVERRH